MVKKIKMSRGITLTFEEGCNKYLENCRQRNLREGTIGHYKQSKFEAFKTPTYVANYSKRVNPKSAKVISYPSSSKNGEI